MSETEKLFHLYLISDSTGETINAVAKAVCARFEGARAIEHSYGLIRSSKQLDRALKAIESAPGPVLYSIVQPELSSRLEEACKSFDIRRFVYYDDILISTRDTRGSTFHSCC